MKKLLYTIFIFIISFSTFSACDESEELTPKVDDTTSDYLLPTGVFSPLKNGKKSKNVGMNIILPLISKIKER